ncbi:hypothetical protein KI688_010411 [Linnemannia hyalina]|uniref:Uncharacterized protein n=1 Tax=Linnemannia hyalina TaxID=64524 RepID=A0A9P7Y0D2_9FUNG|nr:hypothetical protein KI688_010411 [Linnemannia hyalina]
MVSSRSRLSTRQIQHGHGASRVPSPVILGIIYPRIDKGTSDPGNRRPSFPGQSRTIQGARHSTGLVRPHPNRNNRQGSSYPHPDALAGWPVVKEVNLQDSVVVHLAVEISSWTPVHLPQLTTLNLNGAPARLLHPDTLHSTVSLELLTLVMADNNLYMCEYDFDDIEAGNYGGDEDEDEEDDDNDLDPFTLYPSINQLLPSPMLRQTPSLAQLFLIIILSEGDHERTVTIDELRDHDRPVPEGESTTGFISLPKMTHIMLVTGWTVGPQFWQTLFRKVMPSIAMIRETETSGFTLPDWVDATLGLEKLRFAGMMLTVKYKEPFALGLTALDEFVGTGGIPQFYFVDAADKEYREEEEEFEESLTAATAEVDIKVYSQDNTQNSNTASIQQDSDESAHGQSTTTARTQVWQLHDSAITSSSSSSFKPIDSGSTGSSQFLNPPSHSHHQHSTNNSTSVNSSKSPLPTSPSQRSIEKAIAQKFASLGMPPQRSPLRTRLDQFLLNESPRIIFLSFWSLLQFLIFYFSFEIYNRSTHYSQARTKLGVTLGVAKGSAAVINFDCGVILLSNE